MAAEHPLKRLAGAFAFVLTIVAGITFGYLYTAAEALEDKLKHRHHSSAPHPPRR